MSYLFFTTFKVPLLTDSSQEKPSQFQCNYLYRLFNFLNLHTYLAPAPPSTQSTFATGQTQGTTQCNFFPFFILVFEKTHNFEKKTVSFELHIFRMQVIYYSSKYLDIEFGKN